MADVNANIGINIDSSNALAQLKALQRQISQFHTSISRSSEAAALAQRGLQKNLLNSINSIGAFSAEMRTVKTSAESFTNSLEKNKFSMREYFRYAGGATKTFGRAFKTEFDTIGKVAEERVKTLQTQYIKMGRNASGAMEAIAIRPTSLNMQDYGTKTAIAAQKQALFNQLMKQGSTNLLNFGKNTQWSGRQLMVGFTLPLIAVGSAAAKAFMDMEAQALRFRKVYGDLFTPQSETQAALENITELGKQFTKYGVAVSTTVGLAAEAAAAGFQGLDLQRQTTEATRLSILGQVDSQKALETTISLQNAFGMSSEKLADSINFLNAVENQTVVSLDDITTAIPKVAPVIQQLGGDVKDLTFFIAAMKEGGINASEGANALKSGLAALINPTKKASDMLASFGINATAIVEKNKGNLKATVVEFANALNGLDPLSRARAIEQMFGKFQFARLSTLFANVAKDGNQAARVLDLANSSVEELASLSEKELGMTAESSMNKFRKATEDLKVALVPVGQAFLEALTPIVEFVGGILEKFANLSDGTKKLITLLTVGIGAIGPVLLMTFGLLANGVANIIKLFLTLRGGYQRLTGQTSILGEQTQYMTMEQLDASAAAHSLNQTHAKLIQTFTAERIEIAKLISAYNSAAGAARNFSMNNPGMMMPGRATRKFAKGIVSVPGPKGAGDVVPAMVSPGESIIPAAMTKKYAPLIQGMIADNIPGYQMGKGFKNATMFLPESINTAMGQNVGRGVPTGNVAQYLGSSGGASMAPLLAVIARDLKVGINNPKFKQEFATVANLFAQTATDALNKSGREFIKDADIEEIIVPALRDAAKGIKIAGKDIDVALENAVNQIRTVGPVGVGSGSMGGMGRTTFPGSYRGARGAAQKFALEQNPGMFQQTERLSQSKGKIVKSFQTLNPALNKFETATMSHITTSVTASVNDLTTKMAPYLGDVGAKITKAVTKNVAQGAIKEARVASPSRETEMVGASIAQGFVSGAQEYVDDAKRVGQQLGGGMVQTASGLIIPGGAIGGGAKSTTPGININDIAAKARMNRDALLATAALKQTEKMNARMGSLNKAFMSGTFALSALSGVASMAGGNLGKFSQILFTITGPLFALSSILQMLTGTPIVSFIANLGKLKFGLIAVGITALVVGFNLLNKAREKERMAIEGLADAATLTKSKLATLGEFFNVTPIKRSGAVLTDIQTKPTERTKIQELKNTEGFKKDFKKDISSLKTATEGQALLLLQTLSLDLRSQGFAKEQVDIIIKAIAEEAKKSKLILKFAQLDLSKEEGRVGAISLAQDITKNFNSEFSKGVQKGRKSFLGIFSGFGPEQLKLTNDQQAQLKLGSQELGNVLTGLTGSFKAGDMKGSEYKDTLTKILGETKGTAYGNLLLKETLIKLDPEFAKATAGVKDYDTRLLLLEASLLGVAIAEDLVLKAINGSVYERAVAQAKIREILGQRTKDEEAAAAAAIAAAKRGLGEKDALKEKIKALRDQTAAFTTLIGKQVDFKTALELTNDAEIVKRIIDINAIKNIKQRNKEMDAFIKLTKIFKKESQRNENIVADPRDKEIRRLDNLQKFIALNEKLIDLRAAPQIKAFNDELEKQEGLLQNVNDEIQQITRSQIDPIQKIIDANNYALQAISLREDAINEKYNKQVEALDKIEKANQNIANIQKQRMSIADALTRGDISAAAQAVQEARTERAQSALTGQRDILTRVRDQNIEALGRVAIEKTNKALQFEIATIERGRLLTLQGQKTEIENQIDATNRKLKALNLTVEKEKDSARYMGETKSSIETSKTLLELSKGPLDTYAEKLANSALSAKQIADYLAAALKTQQEMSSVVPLPSQASVTAGVKAGTITAANATPEQKAVSLQIIKDTIAKVNSEVAKLNKITQRRMFGGPILSKGRGGMGAVKAMAFGGRAIGSDSVPAMLTPGEFVMNKAASKAYGPLLERINESKYPGMLGGGGMTQIPVNNISTSMNDNSTAVYNYNLGFSINGANGNANDIARAVMREIKNVDSQRIRSQRV